MNATNCTNLGLGPQVPRNWYLVGPSRRLRPGQIISYNFAGRDIVVFRSLDGHKLVALDGRCRHMGCHLRHGRVVSDGLLCALHHRKIFPDGRLIGGMGGNETIIQQPVFPAIEHLGAIFVFLGDGDPPPLPMPEIAKHSNIEFIYVADHYFPLPWQPIVANGFDIEHLSSVHNRKLLEPPTFTRLSDRLCLNYHTKPWGGKFSDRFTAWIAPEGVRGQITSLSGTLMLIESTLGKRDAFLLLSFLPDERGGTTIRGITGMKSKGLRAWTRLTLIISRKLFRAFLHKDLRIMEDLKWREPQSLGGLGDDYTRQLCDYFRNLRNAF